MQRLVVGLGNPGPEYSLTRHNVGVRVVERFAATIGAHVDAPRFEGRFGEGMSWRSDSGAEGLDVGILVPLTFMNRSGSAVAAALAAHPELDPAHDLLVVFDDLDLPFGRLRLRPAGGPGGHNGLGDVLEALGSRDVPRLRFGIGRPPADEDPVDYVLSPFTAAEEAALPSRIAAAAEAVADAIDLGVRPAMNHVNQVPSEEG